MAVTITEAVSDAMCNASVDLVDAGSGAGYIEIYTAAFAVKLAILIMTDPAFGASSAGVATADTIADEDSALDTGTAATFKMFDSDDTEILQGSVGTSGEDINLSSVAITTADVVSITALTATMPVA